MPSNLSPKTRYAARKPSETNPNAIFDCLINIPLYRDKIKTRGGFSLIKNKIGFDTDARRVRSRDFASKPRLQTASDDADFVSA